MRHHWITVALVVAAVCCYLLGMQTGFALLLVVGLFLEGVTWMRTGRRSKARND